MSWRVGVAVRTQTSYFCATARPFVKGRPLTEQIVSLDTYDVRFPTSRHLDGSDAMNPFPDYSAAYVVLKTSAGREGYGLAFTVGRGNEVQIAGIQALAPLVVGRSVDDLLS